MMVLVAGALLAAVSASSDQRADSRGGLGIRAFELLKRQNRPKPELQTTVGRTGRSIRVRISYRPGPGNRKPAGIGGRALRAALREVARGQRTNGSQLVRIEKRLDALSEMLSHIPQQIAALGVTLAFAPQGGANQGMTVAELSIPEKAAQQVVQELAVSDRAVLLRLRETVDGRAPLGEAGSPVTPRLISALQEQGLQVFSADKEASGDPVPLRVAALDSLAAWVVEAQVTTRRLGRFEEIYRYASRAELQVRDVRTGELLLPLATGEVEGNAADPSVAADQARVRVTKEIRRRLSAQLAQIAPPRVKVHVPASEASVVPELRRAIASDPDLGLVLLAVETSPEGSDLEIRAPDGAASVGDFLGERLAGYELVAPGPFEVAVAPRHPSRPVRRTARPLPLSVLR